MGAKAVSKKSQAVPRSGYHRLSFLVKYAAPMILFAVALFSETGFGWTLLAPGSLGWRPTRVPLSINPSGCPISQDQLIAAADKAVSVWNSSALSSLVLVRVQEWSSLTVTDFTNGTATGGPYIACDTAFEVNQGVDADSIPAVTRVAVAGGRLLSAGVFLNAESAAQANVSTLTEGQFELTVVHEMGHALGLGHSSIPEALMYFSLMDKTDSILTADEEGALVYLYPSEEFSKNPFGCASTRISKRAKANSPAGILLLAVFVLSSVLVGRWLQMQRKEDA